MAEEKVIAYIKKRHDDAGNAVPGTYYLIQEEAEWYKHAQDGIRTRDLQISQEA